MITEVPGGAQVALGSPIPKTARPARQPDGSALSPPIEKVDKNTFEFPPIIHRKFTANLVDFAAFTVYPDLITFCWSGLGRRISKPAWVGGSEHLRFLDLTVGLFVWVGRLASPKNICREGTEWQNNGSRLLKNL
jgi:hypothetical protein